MCIYYTHFCSTNTHRIIKRFLTDCWIVVPNSGEAQVHLIEFGRADHCVCWMLVGYDSGYATFCLKRDIYSIEQKCLTRGDRICSTIDYIKSVLEVTGGNQTRAARILGISATTLWRKLKRQKE